MSFGVLTLATRKDMLKAIGLSISLRISNPNVKLAVACSREIEPVLKPYFDFVILENPNVRGFRHKLQLDKYSPFEETFFFDADVLVFRRLDEVADVWRERPYTACGERVSAGTSPFGLRREEVLRKIGHTSLVHIDGAGHAFFRKPECEPLFEAARSIADNYESLVGKIKFADEDVMNIAMTVLGLEPMPREGFWSRYCSAKPGTLKLDATLGQCSFTDAVTGFSVNPYMMHFAANEAPIAYLRQLIRLFSRFGVKERGLISMTGRDSYLRYFRWPLSRKLSQIRALVSP